MPASIFLFLAASLSIFTPDPLLFADGDKLSDFGIGPAGDGAQQGPVQGGGPDQDLVVIGDPHARGGTRNPGGTGGGTGGGNTTGTGGTGTGAGTGTGTGTTGTGGGAPPAPGPTGPQGQTPGSDYEYTDANGDS
jgi:hypothetical protein